MVRAVQDVNTIVQRMAVCAPMIAARSPLGKEEPALDGPIASPWGPQETIKPEPTVTLMPSQIHVYMAEKSARYYISIWEAWKRADETGFAAAYRAYLRGDDITPRPLDSKASQLLRGPPNPSFAAVETLEDAQAFAETHTPHEAMSMRQFKGKELEASIMDAFEEHEGLSVSRRNVPLYWHSGMTTSYVGRRSAARDWDDPMTDPGPYAISGEIDGCTDDVTHTPVECKLRFHELGTIDDADMPPRDMYQLQAYMALTCAPAAHYVQMQLGGSGVCTTLVPRDERMWVEDILPAMRRFVLDVRRAMRGSPKDIALRRCVMVEAQQQMATVSVQQLHRQPVAPSAVPVRIPSLVPSSSPFSAPLLDGGRVVAAPFVSASSGVIHETQAPVMHAPTKQRIALPLPISKAMKRAREAAEVAPVPLKSNGIPAFLRRGNLLLPLETPLPFTVLPRVGKKDVVHEKIRRTNFASVPVPKHVPQKATKKATTWSQTPPETDFQTESDTEDDDPVLEHKPAPRRRPRSNGNPRRSSKAYPNKAIAFTRSRPTTRATSVVRKSRYNLRSTDTDRQKRQCF